MPEVIWAPWRMEYILSKKPNYCIFCEYLAEDRDEENLILLRGKKAFAIMNRYPYTNGHLLVLPNRHTADFGSLDPEEREELFALLQQTVSALQRGFAAEGMNIGLNLGKAAGAGIEEHVHFHVAPRWVGDANYMTVCGDVRVVPEHIRTTFAKLKNFL